MIEKLNDKFGQVKITNNVYQGNHHITQLSHKINEVIQAVNEIKDQETPRPNMD